MKEKRNGMRGRNLEREDTWKEGTTQADGNSGLTEQEPHTNCEGKGKGKARPETLGFRCSGELDRLGKPCSCDDLIRGSRIMAANHF